MIPNSRHALIPDVPKTRHPNLIPDTVKNVPNSRHTQFHVFIETINSIMLYLLQSNRVHLVCMFALT